MTDKDDHICEILGKKMQGNLLQCHVFKHTAHG